MTSLPYPIFYAFLGGMLLLIAVLYFMLRSRNEGSRELLLKQDVKLSELANLLRVLEKNQQESLSNLRLDQQQLLGAFREQMQKEFHLQRTDFDKRQIDGLKTLQESVQNYMQDIRSQLTTTLQTHFGVVGKHLDKLTEETHTKLTEISGQVEKRLVEGFEKTTVIFADIVRRLALIDEAQKRITELSTNVVSLQEVLSDKKSRGAFGEVQLAGLIRNMMPETSYSFQKTLSNDKRADCMLHLPEPTGNIVVDAKFPLESYRRMLDPKAGDSDRRAAEQQFRIDMRKHINDIASKYIIPGETSDGAVMFIPAEAVFAEIHGHYPDIVDEAHKLRVWMVSPTTMMAILTTARAVIKDADTTKQVHIIQEHLAYLAKDFERFQTRMENLAKHIEQAHDDVKAVNTSARKITSRFQKIEKVDLSVETEEEPALVSVSSTPSVDPIDLEL